MTGPKLGRLTYPSVFRNALSYEYFLARIEQIRLARDRAIRPTGWIEGQIERVAIEVEAYYTEGEVLHQFSEIQRTLDDLKRDGESESVR